MLRTGLLVSFILVITACSENNSQSADLIFHNAQVVTAAWSDLESASCKGGSHSHLWWLTMRTNRKSEMERSNVLYGSGSSVLVWRFRQQAKPNEKALMSLSRSSSINASKSRSDIGLGVLDFASTTQRVVGFPGLNRNNKNSAIFTPCCKFR